MSKAKKQKDRYCVYQQNVAKRLLKIARGATDAIIKMQKLYPKVDFHGVLLGVVHRAATVATNGAKGKPLGRTWTSKP